MPPGLGLNDRDSSYARCLDLVGERIFQRRADALCRLVYDEENDSLDILLV